MSIQVQTGASAIDWSSILSKLGDVEKTTDVNGKEVFKITTKTADGTERTATIGVPDLELPNGVDSASLESLVSKLEATGLGFTEEQIKEMKEAVVKAYESAAKAVGDVKSFSKGKVLFDLYALMSLMIEIAQAQRDSAREMRTAQNQSIQKAIMDQADQQRQAAMTGMIVGIVCGAASAAVSIGMMVGQSFAAKSQSQIMNQSGADSANMRANMLQNTDTTAHADAQLNKITAKVGNEVATRVSADFDSKLTGAQAGDLGARVDAAANRVATAEQNLQTKTSELETAQANLDQKSQAVTAAEQNFTPEKKAALEASREKQNYITEQMNAHEPVDPERIAQYDARIGNVDIAEAKTAEATLNTANQEKTLAQNEVNIKQNAVDLANTELTNAKTELKAAQNDYVKTVQDVAAQYKDKYQQAIERQANPPPGADKKQLAADVKAAKTDMEMAFAKEAKLLSDNNVISPADMKDIIAAARVKVDVSTDRAMQRMDFKSAERRISTLMGVNNINQSIGGVLQTMSQSLATMQSAEATKISAQTKAQEEMFDQTKDLFQQEQKVIDAVLQLLSAVISTETQSMRDAIQA